MLQIFYRVIVCLVKPRPHTVNRIVRLVAFDNIASPLLLVCRELKGLDSPLIVVDNYKKPALAKVHRPTPVES